MRPRLDEALAQKIAATTATPKAMKRATSAEKKVSPPPPSLKPLPSAVELWLEVVEREDREVFGWILLANRTPKTKAGFREFQIT